MSNRTYDVKLGLAGNPNVGKSTVFNGLTGLNQHTGNWPGKTVTNAVGYFDCGDKTFAIYDLPGTYSLVPHSAEEEVTRDFILNDDYDAIIVVCDAMCLERNLNLVLQILDITKNVIVCVNLLDEARKKKIRIDLDKLSEMLGVNVVGMSARSGEGIDELREMLVEACNFPPSPKNLNLPPSPKFKKAEEICREVVHFEDLNYASRDRKIDRVLTSKWFGIPIMLLLLMAIFWITIEGANYPSSLLFKFSFWLGDRLEDLLMFFHAPQWLISFLIFRRVQSACVGGVCDASADGDFLSTFYAS